MNVSLVLYVRKYGIHNTKKDKKRQKTIAFKTEVIWISVAVYPFLKHAQNAKCICIFIKTFR